MANIVGRREQKPFDLSQADAPGTILQNVWDWARSVASWPADDDVNRVRAERWLARIAH